MCHKQQKVLNKIASGLRGNEFSMYGYFINSTESTREFVKREKLHYTKKMVEKSRRNGTW